MHVDAHAPAVQSVRGPQVFPQAPQFALSVAMSAQ
jgi:hypothetical protein